MYDELIKRLRASCDSCKLWDGYKCCLKGECTAQTRLQAADAIEELTDRNVGKWIPVTERLPEIGTYIIAGHMKYDYEKVYTHFVDVAYFGPLWNDTDYSWQTFNDWFEGQQEFEITHWMPLPEPPRESES